MSKNSKNVVYAQIVKGMNQKKQVSYKLVLSVVVQKEDRSLILPFKTIFLSEFDSIMIQDFCGVAEGKNLNNPNIIAQLKRGISQKGNLYYIFDISLLIDNDIVPYKQVLVFEFEKIALTKRCGFDLTDLETIEVSEDILNVGA